MKKACPRFKPIIPGTHRTFEARAPGVRYFLQRDVLTGLWFLQATIRKQTRSIAGGPWKTKAKALKAACEHLEFHNMYFKGQR